MNKMILKILLICFCIVSFCSAEELSFNGKAEFYGWMAKSEEASSIHFLKLEDLWSSRRLDFNPKQHFEHKDFTLITQIFSELTFLRLNSTVRLTDESLKQLANLPLLTRIELKGDYLYSHFTDNVFCVIAEAAPQLKTLSLEGPFPKFNAQSLANAIQSMPNLESVILLMSYHKCDFNSSIGHTGSMLKILRPSLHVFVNGVELE